MNRAIEPRAARGKPRGLRSSLVSWPCAALFLCGAPALAQTAAQQPVPVWRCGDSYSHQPCESGMPVDVRDARTPEQQRQAQEQAGRIRTFGDALHRENAEREAQRRKEEIARQRALARQQAALLRAERKARAARHEAVKPRSSRRGKSLETRRAVVPRPKEAMPSPPR